MQGEIREMSPQALQQAEQADWAPSSLALPLASQPASLPLPLASPPPFAPQQSASELPVAALSLVEQAPLATIPETPAIPDSVRNDLVPEQVIQAELDKEAEYQSWLGWHNPEFLKPGRDAPLPSWGAWALKQAQESAEAISERLRLRFLGPSCVSGPRP